LPRPWRATMADTRVGLGFDSHPRDEDRPLRLGGIEFEGEPGLAGHSDGDVVCHALADAFLGAAALGDLGHHFPDEDPAIEGISGPDVLGRVVSLLRDSGFDPATCDLVVIADRPRLAERRDEMRRSLAGMLGVSVEVVSVKATRPEGLGLGADGVACMAVATIDRR
jgi:2-C-methyl-D-erythritol 2,4-cyclodiphosphate synthase